MSEVSSVYWVPLGSFIVSLTALVSTAVSTRNRSISERVGTLEDRLQEVEAKFKACADDRADLRQELFKAMSELVEIRRRARLHHPETRKR